MGKAEIEGLKMEPKENKEEKELTLDEIIENTKESHLIELELSKEATRLAMGESSDEYIYNIPRETKDYGKEDWGIMCDKMPRGYCKCRADKKTHVHTLGVNISGALVIMNAYMGLDIEPSDPEIKEFTMLDNGKLITRSYWYVNVKGKNKKTEITLTLPFMQPTMKKSGNYYNFDEHGPQITVSKAIRNLILKIVPGDFQRNWIKDYMEGPEKPKDKPKDKTKDKPEDKPSGNKPSENGTTELTIDSAIELINAIDNVPHLSNWYNKNANWFGKLKTEERKKITDCFNAKKDQLSNPSGGKDNEVPMATSDQYNTMQALAQELSYDPEQFNAICISLVGTDDVPGMTFEQAGEILTALKQTKEQRKSQAE